MTTFEGRPLFDPHTRLAPKLSDAELDRYMEENGYGSSSETEKESKPKVRNPAFKRFQMSDRELDDYVEAESRMDAMAERMEGERPGYMKMYEATPDEQDRVRESALAHIREERDELNRYMNGPYQGTVKDESEEGRKIRRRYKKAGFDKLMRRYAGDDPKLYVRQPAEKIDVWPPVDAKPWGHLPWYDPIDASPEDPYSQDDLDSELPMRQPVLARAGKGCEIPNFKGSYLGRFPLVLADFWTSDHLSERSRP